MSETNIKIGAIPQYVATKNYVRTYNWYPDTVDLAYRFGRVENQGNQNTCTAFAGLAWYNEWLVRKGQSWQDFSEQALYWEERFSNNDENSDTGAWMSDILYVLTNFGVMREKDSPYAHPNLTSRPDPTRYIEGSKLPLEIVRQLYTHGSALCQDIIDSLSNGFPVLFGLQVFSGFVNVGSDGIVTMPTTGEISLGGHAIVAIGYDMERKLIKCRNSWGESHGDNGHVWLPFDFFNKSTFANDWVREAYVIIEPFPPASFKCFVRTGINTSETETDGHWDSKEENTKYNNIPFNVKWDTPLLHVYNWSGNEKNAHIINFGYYKVPVSSIHILCHTYNSPFIADGTKVATLKYTYLDGSITTQDLIAGINIGEWAFERAGVGFIIKHKQPLNIGYTFKTNSASKDVYNGRSFYVKTNLDYSKKLFSIELLMEENLELGVVIDAITIDTDADKQSVNEQGLIPSAMCLTEAKRGKILQIKGNNKNIRTVATLTVTQPPTNSEYCRLILDGEHADSWYNPNAYTTVESLAQAMRSHYYLGWTVSGSGNKVILTSNSTGSKEVVFQSESPYSKIDSGIRMTIDIAYEEIKGDSDEVYVYLKQDDDSNRWAKIITDTNMGIPNVIELPIADESQRGRILRVNGAKGVAEVRELYVKKDPTNSGNITLTMDGVTSSPIYIDATKTYEVASLDITYVPTNFEYGKITIRLDGDEYYVNVNPISESTPERVASWIRNDLSPKISSRWTVSGAGSNVIFTSIYATNIVDATYSPNDTGILGTMTTTTQGFEEDITRKIRENASFTGWNVESNYTSVEFTSKNKGKKSSGIITVNAGGTGVEFYDRVLTLGVDGTEDKAYICKKLADDTYAWVELLI